MKPFDIIKSIMQEKEPLLKAEVLSCYSEFYVNSVLSAHYQNILLVQEMNKHFFMDKWAQYLFYFYGCDKVFRIPFKKSEKKEDDIKEDLIKLKQFFPDYSDEKLREIYTLIDKEILKLKTNKMEKYK